MSKSFDALKPYLEKAQAYQTAQTLFDWDNETLAPEKAAPYTAKVIGVLSSSYFDVMNDGNFQKLLRACQEDESLTKVERAIVREVLEEAEKLAVIPQEEYRQYAELTAESAGIWARARKEQDFEAFAPTLKKVLSFQKKFASYRAREGQKPYDVLLEDYEKGFSMKELDAFFETLKSQIVPFLKKLMECGALVEDDFLRGDYCEEKQAELGRFFAEYLGFDFQKGVLATSAHPFTTNLHNHDVRITTAFNDRVDDSIFSVIHETGHALYEFGIPDELTMTPVGGGASMGMHESQSRFFENILGRSQAFWEPVYPKLQEVFPDQLGKVELSRFVKAINKVQPSLIRTQADELTYSLHVLIRYEMEKQLFEGSLSVEELPQVWADLYEEYLGVRPQNVAEGVLQDIHWSQGSFGYFPSYALGSAFGAQLYQYMKTVLDVEELLKQGHISEIREFLRVNVHQYGKLKTSRQILKDVTGRDFDPQCYVDYLVEKYSRIYGLS